MQMAGWANFSQPAFCAPRCEIAGQRAEDHDLGWAVPPRDFLRWVLCLDYD